MPTIKIPQKVLVHRANGMPYYSTRMKSIFVQGPASSQPIRFQDLAIKSLEDVDYAAILEKLKSDFGDKLFTETLETFRSGQQEGKLLVNSRTNTLVALVVTSGDKKVVHSPMLTNDRDIKTIQSFVQTKFGGDEESAVQKFAGYIEKAKANLIPKEVDIHREGKLFQGIRWVKPEKGMETPSGVRVPPNWQKVQIASSAKSGLQAIGIDSKGRCQYLYSAAFRNKQNIKKFSRLKAFSSKFPQIQARIMKDLPKLEEAEVLYLVMKTGFRIGSDKETLAAKKAYGASTLLRDHVEIEGDTLHFHFPAKKGTVADKTITDPVLAKILSKKQKGQQLFSVADTDVRDYLGHIGGAKFLIKDFRTYMGTSVAIKAMHDIPAPTTEKELKRAKKKVAEIVATQLCNTPAVALSSYIAPEVFSSWESGLATIQKADQNAGFENVPDLVERVSYDEELPELDPEEKENDDEDIDEIESIEKHLQGQHDQSKHGNEESEKLPNASQELYDYQWTKLERPVKLIQRINTPNNAAEANVGFRLENAGDAFREIAKPNFSSEEYVEEKLSRIEHSLNDSEWKKSLSDEGKTALENLKRTILRAPVRTDRHRAAQRLMLNIVDRNLDAIRQDIREVRNSNQIQLEKLQPPREGLVPQSGNWDKPFRWIRPEEKNKSIPTLTHMPFFGAGGGTSDSVFFDKLRAEGLKVNVKHSDATRILDERLGRPAAIYSFSFGYWARESHSFTAVSEISGKNIQNAVFIILTPSLQTETEIQDYNLAHTNSEKPETREKWHKARRKYGEDTSDINKIEYATKVDISPSNLIFGNEIYEKLESDLNANKWLTYSIDRVEEIIEQIVKNRKASNLLKAQNEIHVWIPDEGISDGDTKLEKSRVAYHEHDGFQEHPVRVGDHQKWFAGEDRKGQGDVSNLPQQFNFRIEGDKGINASLVQKRLDEFPPHFRQIIEGSKQNPLIIKSSTRARNAFYTADGHFIRINPIVFNLGFAKGEYPKIPMAKFGELIVLHEMSHALFYRLMTDHPEIRAEWTEASREYGKWRKSGQLITKYSSEGAHEFFAECTVYYLRAPKILKQVHPTVSAFFDKYFSQQPQIEKQDAAEEHFKPGLGAWWFETEEGFNKLLEEAKEQSIKKEDLPNLSSDHLLDISFQIGKSVDVIQKDIQSQFDSGVINNQFDFLKYVQENYGIELKKADSGFEQYLDSSQPQNLEIETHEVVMWGGWHIREHDETGDTLRIKIDAQYSEKARPLVIFHEIREDYYMRSLNLSYEQAHKKASEDEKAEFGEEAFNSEVGETRDVLAQNRGHKNVAKSNNEEIEKLQPPREGLVPKSGNYEKPYRWIRPEDKEKQDTPTGYLVMYHGTTPEKAIAIQEKGFNPGSYLTPDPDVAQYNADGIVLRVVVPEKSLKQGEYESHFITTENVKPIEIGDYWKDETYRGDLPPFLPGHPKQQTITLYHGGIINSLPEKGWIDFTTDKEVAENRAAHWKEKGRVFEIEIPVDGRKSLDKRFSYMANMPMSKLGHGQYQYKAGTIKEAIAAKRKAIEGAGEEFEIKNADIALSVKAIILDKDGKLLLLRNNPQYSKFEFDLPGGHIDNKKDGDEKEALTREVFEETGLTITNISNISGSSLDIGDDVRIGKDNHPALFYEVEVQPGEIKTSNEHIGYDWISAKDLDKIDLGAFTKMLKAFFASEEPIEKAEYAGGIIALVPFEEISKQLEISDGIPHNEMHITLAYIKYPWYSDPIDIVRDLDTPKFQGKISGFERFKDSNSEKDAFVARIDVPELDNWRTQLTGKLIDAGFSLSDYYTFKPHITLAYLEKDQENPQPPRKEIPIIFKSIEVWNGEDKQTIIDLNEHDNETKLEKSDLPDAAEIYSWIDDRMNRQTIVISEIENKVIVKIEEKF